MGREIKRVPLDFDWPLNQVWEGYINPWRERASSCPLCAGSGYNAATKHLRDSWYNLGGPRYSGWQYHLTQHDVDALVAANRLWEFTRVVVPGKGWQPKDPPYHPTADEVNEWAKHGFGHDGLNCMICVRARAERLGVYGLCEVCDGEGEVWASPEYRARSEAWTSTEPPVGEGWQVWETVSEGSPVSPVFASRDALVDYLIEQGYSRKAAVNFCEDSWVFSMMMVNGEIVRDIETASIG